MTDVVEDLSLEEAKRIVLGKLGGTRAKVYLFGSRAWGEARRRSDIDIGVLPYPRRSLRRSAMPWRRARFLTAWMLWTSGRLMSHSAVGLWLREWRGKVK